MKEAIVSLIEVAIKFNRCLAFNYEAKNPKSGEKIQMPLVRPLGIEYNEVGIGRIIGINLRRIEQDSFVDDAIRSYRLDRIQNCIII